MCCLHKPSRALLASSYTLAWDLQHLTVPEITQLVPEITHLVPEITQRGTYHGT